MDVAGFVIAPDVEHSPLIDLPNEIWGKILKNVTQKDALNLRLTDKEFKNKVNNLYEDWEIRIDEESPFLEMILDLRVKEVRVKSLTKQPSFRPPGILFKYPDLIQTIISCETISSENEHILLQSKNVKWISVYLRGGNAVPLDPLIGYNFPELHTIEMSLCCTQQDNYLQPGGLFYRIMMRSTIPKLKTFKVQYFDPPNAETAYHFASIVISFLSRNGQNLRFFCYGNDNKYEDYSVFPVLDDSAVLNNMKSLEILRLSSGRSYNDEPLTETLRQLIQNQKNLIVFHLNQTFEVNNSLCEQIAEHNFKSLEHVKIERLTYTGRGVAPAVGEFDVSVFKNCHSLLALELSDLHSSFFPTVQESHDHELVNLCFLPKQIEYLFLQGFVVDSQDISNFLNNHPSINHLNILTTDLDASVLESVMAHGALLFAYLRWIDVPKSRLKLAKLKVIYEKLGCEKVQNEFVFHKGLLIRRESLTTDWEGVYNWNSM